MKKLLLLAMVIGLLVGGCAVLEPNRERDNANFGRIVSGAGMTRDQVLTVIGYRPDSINSTITSSGVREQWVYRNGWLGNYGTIYLYFKNGILISMQVSQ